MVEDRIQNKQPVDETEKTDVPQVPKGSVGKKIGKAFSDMYGLFNKGKGKDLNKASEDSFQRAPEYKKPTITIPSYFSAQNINLKSVNQFLMVVLAGLFILMFYVTFRQRPAISSVMSAVSKIKIMDIETKPIVTFKALPYYIDQVEKRNIFKAWEKKKSPVEVVEEVEPPPPPPPPKVSIEQKAKNFKLMGISWGNNPKVIIMDTTSQSMYFIREGEKIKGTDLTIESIFKDQVTITSDGDEMSMY